MPAHAQTIHGTIVSQTTDAPIAFASVALVTQAGTVTKVTITDAEGGYSLTASEPGIYSLRVDAAGFNTLNGIMFRARPGQTIEFDLRIWELTELAPVIIEAEREPVAPGPLEGFYERQKLGRGQYLTREEMEEHGSARFTDVIRMVPGIRIVTMQSSLTVRFNRVMGSCPPVLWVDLVKWGSIDLDGGPDRALVPSELEGIELYTPMQVPPEFATSDSSCGVVVVWTKRGS